MAAKISLGVAELLDRELGNFARGVIDALRQFVY